MKIVDTFSFSEDHEKEVLFLKFILENNYVDEWVIVENDYTLRGEYKGYVLDKILENTRFESYFHKIKYIQCSFHPYDIIDKHDGVYDVFAQEVEEEQREYAKRYILEKYVTDCYILISDTDEMIDFSNKRRADLVLERLSKKDNYLKIPRLRYWYDFDNLWSESRSIPAVSVEFLKKNEFTLSRMRFHECGIGPTPLWKENVAFEYSYCFPKKAILRKYDTFMHTGQKHTEIETAIVCNHIPVSSIRGGFLTLEKKFWLSKVSLTEFNSPEYVRKNLDLLRTNVVPGNYLENRKKYYPQYFSALGKIKYGYLPKANRLIKKIKYKSNYYFNKLLVGNKKKAIS